jgi:branched-chain amino acid transport system substrate-binding protein
MRRSAIFGMFAAALVAAASGCSTSASGGSPPSGSTSNSPQGITKTEINLGTSLPLTGGAASSGASFKAGLEASVQEINKAGGINGRKINLTILDDGFDPARTVANMLRLETQDDVFALDMPVGSAGIPGSFPEVQRLGIPMFGPYLPPDPNLPSVFELATPHEQQGQIITDWLASKKITRVAFIGQDNDYGQAVLKGVKDNATKDGVTLVSTGLTETNSTDVSPAVLSVKAKNPQAVVLGTDNTQTALVLKQAAQLGWKPLWVGDSSAMNTGTSVATAPAGAAANGIYGAAVAALPSSTGAAIAKFRAAMTEYEPGTAPDLYSLIAYATNQVLFHILTLMGNNLTWANFDKTAQSLKDYNTGLLPPITFAPLPSGHTGSHGLLIARYENGTWSPVTGFMTANQG